MGLLEGAPRGRLVSSACRTSDSSGLGSSWIAEVRILGVLRARFGGDGHRQRQNECPHCGTSLGCFRFQVKSRT